MINKENALNLIKALIIVQLFVYAFQVFLFVVGDVNFLDFSLYLDLGFIIIAILAFFAFFLFNGVAKKPKYLTKSGNRFLLVSLVLVTLGHLVWFVFQDFLSNAVWLGALTYIIWSLTYFFVIIAFFIYNFEKSKKRSKTKNLLIYLGFILAVVDLAIMIIVHSNFLSLGFLNIARYLFPAYDLIIWGLIFAILVPASGERGKEFLGVYILSVGFLTQLFFDHVLAYLLEFNFYYVGHWIDLIYPLIYISISFSALFSLRYSK